MIVLSHLHETTRTIDWLLNLEMLWFSNGNNIYGKLTEQEIVSLRKLIVILVVLIVILVVLIIIMGI